ncbi:MAG: Asp-tRNA(Asn)/Glu-tRNA(Gln) amidotransferase subunit GatC [Crenarchaeota archaeon]|nr:Asp-tRNA(Asn)/Glu-tRNA(Gln) amidotransferase subunit GatC [Thermoproteota archaeon]
MEEKQPRIDIDHLAWLARLQLSEDEKEEIRRSIERIMEFINRLLEAPVEDVEPLYHPLDKEGLLRPDEPSPGLSQEEALMNAAATENGYFKAPRTLEE